MQPTDQTLIDKLQALVRELRAALENIASLASQRRDIWDVATAAIDKSEDFA